MPSPSRRVLIRLIAAIGATLALPAMADGVSGASVDSYFYGTFQINCTTCGHFDIPLGVKDDAATSDGGPGASAAAIEFSAIGTRGSIPLEYTLGGGLGVAAMASFEGSLSTPVLKARAQADNELVFVPAFSTTVPVGVDSYLVTANANTVQQYSYIGSTPTSYTFHFQVDGSVFSSLASVFASAAIYADASTFFETGLIDAGNASIQGANIVGPTPPFSEPFSVTIDMATAGSFYLLARLGATASSDLYYSGDVIADAYNTMGVTSIDGPLHLLVAGAVPEPSTYASLALGLAALGALVRRRRRG